MALDDFLISTGVDQLIRLVKEKGRIEIGAAAEELKLPGKIVEDWAHVLEEEKLVTIEYRLTKIYLVWHEPTKEYVAQKSEKLREKASSTKSEIDRLLCKVQDEGKALASMQQEIALMSGSQGSPEEARKLKAEIEKMGAEFREKAKVAAEKLDRLRKKAAEAGAKSAGKGEEKRRAACLELKKELAVLRKFEEILSSQSKEIEDGYADFGKKIEEMRQQVEGGDSDRIALEIKDEISSVKALKDELLGAIEAVTEEVRAIDQRINALSARLDEIAAPSGSLSEAKKRLLMLKRMSDDATKQRNAAKERLDESLALIRKQASRIEEILRRAESEAKAIDSMKNDYVDIEEEIGRAKEELEARQKEISSRISAQAASLDAAKSAMSGRFSKDEIDKVSFLLRELRHEQAMLEEKVKSLIKEAEILELEASPKNAGKPQQAANAAAERTTLVEKIRLSQGDEAEFEKKREELRALIRKMWEESKSGREG